MVNWRSGGWKGEGAGQKVWIEAQRDNLGVGYLYGKRWRQCHQIKPNFIYRGILKITFVGTRL